MPEEPRVDDVDDLSRRQFHERTSNSFSYTPKELCVVGILTPLSADWLERRPTPARQCAFFEVHAISLSAG